MIEVEIDLEEKDILFLALEAHKKDMKLNDLIIEIIKDKINGE